MLRLSPNHSAKIYVDDLIKNSVTLQGINEDFRHVESHFRLVSFYESLKTNVGSFSSIVSHLHSHRYLSSLGLMFLDE